MYQRYQNRETGDVAGLRMDGTLAGLGWGCKDVFNFDIETFKMQLSAGGSGCFAREGHGGLWKRGCGRGIGGGVAAGAVGCEGGCGRWGCGCAAPGGGDASGRARWSDRVVT